jgi:hypothetical protein
VEPSKIDAARRPSRGDAIIVIACFACALRLRRRRNLRLSPTWQLFTDMTGRPREIFVASTSSPRFNYFSVPGILDTALDDLPHTDRFTNVPKRIECPFLLAPPPPPDATDKQSAPTWRESAGQRGNRCQARSG